MNNILKNFVYSQNSINTYKSCPLKFKYKYLDKINWRKDDIGSREYYESLQMGSEFHLLCERYFSNIPLGINEKNSLKYTKWMDKIKKLLPIISENKDETIYLPEYEIRYNLNGNTITAKYDLVVINNNKIDIWDWKTENKKVDYKNAQNRIQTIVYMYLAKEVIPKLYNIDVNFEDVTMKYYQPEFEDEPVSISYNEEIHNSYNNRIDQYIQMIRNIELHNVKNDNHCKFCEFNKLCNGQEVEYQLLEEENYEY
ncbi:PD-(D/E)XK nuclease family protein [Romboutsia sp.]|uniref:PD-(D/E)XK nuclease family protein n=1 Tax=Romboutsia sp. TaxID=1965302 RepID=UPI003F36D6EE